MQHAPVCSYVRQHGAEKIYLYECFGLGAYACSQHVRQLPGGLLRNEGVAGDKAGHHHALPALHAKLLVVRPRAAANSQQQQNRCVRSANPLGNSTRTLSERLKAEVCDMQRVTTKVLNITMCLSTDLEPHRDA